LSSYFPLLLRFFVSLLSLIFRTQRGCSHICADYYRSLFRDVWPLCGSCFLASALPPPFFLLFVLPLSPLHPWCSRPLMNMSNILSFILLRYSFECQNCFPSERFYSTRAARSCLLLAFFPAHLHLLPSLGRVSTLATVTVYPPVIPNATVVCSPLSSPPLCVLSYLLPQVCRPFSPSPPFRLPSLRAPTHGFKNTDTPSLASSLLLAGPLRPTPTISSLQADAFT